MLLLGVLASSFATSAWTRRYVIVAPDELEARNDRAWQVSAERAKTGRRSPAHRVLAGMRGADPEWGHRGDAAW